MRIVHELYNRCQVGGGAIRPYARKLTDTSLPTSGYVDEMLILSPAKGFHDTDALYIEGDLQVIHAMLQSALAIVEFAAEEEVKAGTLSPDWKSHDRLKEKENG